MRLYVAGPMTGLPSYNFHAFAEAAARLRAQGHEVISPAEQDIHQGWVRVTYDDFGGILSADMREEGDFDWDTALAWDLRAIDRCDGIYLLPGWSRSRGATKEYQHAKVTGKQILGAVGEKTDSVRSEPLVGLVGYARSGKDTFAGFLGYDRLAFADPLKRLAAFVNPLTAGSGGALLPLETLVEVNGWDRAKEIGVDDPWGTRPYLQRLGEGVRNIIGDDTWVRAAFNQYDPSRPTVVTDVRYPNEVAAIRDRGGVIVRINRAGNAAPNNHISEQLVRDIWPDFDIYAPHLGIDVLKDEAIALDVALRGQA